MDLLGKGIVLSKKRRERDCWGAMEEERMLFVNSEERARSGVRSEILNTSDRYTEEVLRNEKQPWEVMKEY